MAKSCDRGWLFDPFDRSDVNADLTASLAPRRLPLAESHRELSRSGALAMTVLDERGPGLYGPRGCCARRVRACRRERIGSS